MARAKEKVNGKILFMALQIKVKTHTLKSLMFFNFDRSKYGQGTREVLNVG